jgi:hypothetical protein
MTITIDFWPEHAVARSISGARVLVPCVNNQWYWLPTVSWREKMAKRRLMYPEIGDPEEVFASLPKGRPGIMHILSYVFRLDLRFAKKLILELFGIASI